MSRTVLFVCPHSAAKSVIAAAYFRQLVTEAEFQVQIGGTEPDDQIAPHVAGRLLSEGIDVSCYQPRRVTSDDIATAYRVVSLGCSAESLGTDQIERWDEVPPPSQALEEACKQIKELVMKLKERITNEMDNP